MKHVVLPMLLVGSLWVNTSCGLVAGVLGFGNMGEEKKFLIATPPSAPVTESFEPPVIKSMSQSSGKPGDVIEIIGDNLNDPYFMTKIVFVLPSGEKITTSIQDILPDKIKILVPLIDGQSQDIKTNIVLNTGRFETSTNSFILQKPVFNEQQKQLTSGLQQFYQGSASSNAASIDNLINSLKTGATHSDESLKKIDLAMAASLKTEDDVNKFLGLAPRIKSMAVLESSMDIKNESFTTQMLPNGLTECPKDIEDKDIEDTIGDGNLVVLHINGINTSKDGYCKSIVFIHERLNDQSKTPLFKTVKVSGMYQENATDIFNKDSCYQNISSNLPLVGNVFKSICVMKRDVWDEARLQYFQTLFRQAPTRPQVDQLVLQIENILMANNRIILIPHSQGNFFVQQALEKFILKVKKNETKISLTQVLKGLGVIWIASPVSHLVLDPICISGSCNSFYVGISQDPVAQIRFIDQLSEQVMLRATGNLLPTPLGAIARLNPMSNHDLINAYFKEKSDALGLGLEAQPWQKIKTALEVLYKKLESPYINLEFPVHKNFVPSPDGAVIKVPVDSSAFKDKEHPFYYDYHYYFMENQKARRITGVLAAKMAGKAYDKAISIDPSAFKRYSQGADLYIPNGTIVISESSARPPSQLYLIENQKIRLIQSNKSVQKPLPIDKFEMNKYRDGEPIPQVDDSPKTKTGSVRVTID